MKMKFGYNRFQTDISHRRGKVFEQRISTWINRNTNYRAIPTGNIKSNAFLHTDMKLVSSDGLIYPADVKAVKHTFTNRHWDNGKYIEKVTFSDDDWRTIPLEFVSDRGHPGWMYSWKHNINHVLIVHCRYKNENGLLTVFTNEVFDMVYPYYSKSISSLNGRITDANRRNYNMVYTRVLDNQGTFSKAHLVNTHVDDIMKKCKSARFVKVYEL